MAKFETVRVALSPEMAATMRSVVATGEYASESEVLREALTDWAFRRSRRDRSAAELGRLWDEGLASGSLSDGEAAFVRIKASLDRKLAGGEA